MTNSAGGAEWHLEANPESWDRTLASLGGHPLQSALWGDARAKVDGLYDQRWMARREGRAVGMARVELRRIPMLGAVGWVPRGPAGANVDMDALGYGLRERIKASGMMLLVTDRWVAAPNPAPAPQGRRPRTIWIDLASGRDPLWRRLDKGWRYGVRRAERSGVAVSTTREPIDIERFASLCAEISRKKEFSFPGSLPLMKELLAPEGADVEACLFVARVAEKIGAGALVIRSGTSVHYMWGAVDRAFSRDCVGEALQWGVIEWAFSKACRLYDLGGIDRHANPGTFAFKKKMGGVEVELTGKEYFSFGAGGRLVAWLDARRN